jgi:hypothetical protein
LYINLRYITIIPIGRCFRWTEVEQVKVLTRGPQTNTIKWSVQIGAWVSAVVIGTDGTELWKLDIGHFQDPGGGIDLGEIDVATALAR